VPEAVRVAVVIAVVVGLDLWRPWAGLLTAACGGAAAAIWFLLMRLQGLPLAVALPIAVGPGVVSAWLVDRREDFAPAALRDEARILVLCAALVVAVAPGVASGWQSALALNLTDKAASQAIPMWALAVGAGSAALGGVYKLWVRW
jgi:hypothetical protein